MADIAHIAGLVAAGEHPSPVGHAQIVTTTTHKTLRGPRGGLIMCDADYAKVINSAVFPGTQGGPLMHVIAGKAVAFGEALRPEFKDYARRIRVNARALAAGLQAHGLKLISGGTDNHLMLVDLTPLGITGAQAQNALDRAGLTVNKNAIPQRSATTDEDQWYSYRYPGRHHAWHGRGRDGPDRRLDCTGRACHGRSRSPESDCRPGTGHVC